MSKTIFTSTVGSNSIDRPIAGHRVHGVFYPIGDTDELARKLGIAPGDYVVQIDQNAHDRETRRVRKERNKGRTLPGADKKHFGFDDDDSKK